MTQASLYIDLADGENYNVSIIDASGRTLHCSSLQAKGQILYTVNTSGFATGLYHVLFDNGTSRVSRKLIVR